MLDFFKNKYGQMLQSWTIWILIALFVLVIGVIFAISLNKSGGGNIAFIKNLFSFGQWS